MKAKRVFFPDSIVRFFLFSLVLVLAPAFLLAQVERSDQSGVITHIEISGYTRTRPHIARLPLERFLGREAEGLDMLEVQGVIIGTGIFDPLSEELIPGPDGYTLRVVVHEKWAIFPVPMFMASSGDRTFGIFLLDSNAFGLRDMMVAGVLFGPSGWTGVAMYNHSPNRQGLPGMSGTVTYGQRETLNLDRHEAVQRRYSTGRLGISFGLRYPLSNVFSAGLSLGFRDVVLIENDSPLNPPLDGERSLTLNPTLRFQQSSYDGYFLSERSLSTSYTYHHALEGDSFQELGFRGAFEQPLFPALRMLSRIGGVWKSGDDTPGALLHEEGPGRAGVDILPRRFSARHYLGLAAGLEAAVLRNRWGTLSIQGTYQLVFSDGPIGGREWDHGPGAGIRFYLSRLALPAMGASFGYNMKTGIYQISLDMGMEM